MVETVIFPFIFPTLFQLDVWLIWQRWRSFGESRRIPENPGESRRCGCSVTDCNVVAVDGVAVGGSAGAYRLGLMEEVRRWGGGGRWEAVGGVSQHEVRK